MIQLIPANTKINFIGMRFIAFTLSCIFIIGAIYTISTKGLNFGVDFTGGTVMEIRLSEVPDLADLRASLDGATIQEFGAPADLLIRISPNNDMKQEVENLHTVLNDKFDGNVEYRRTEFVGPQVGKELAKKGLYAVIFSLLGILAYIWVRFKWQFGVAAIIALAHDAILTVGLFSATGLEFSLASVAAILMIAGYSINDTVVVFDRIRESMLKFRKKNLPELFNESINQTLTRTVMTSGTTLLALIALYIFGGESIRGFVYAMIFGITVGTYSSIFVAAPVLLLFKPRKSD